MLLSPPLCLSACICACVCLITASALSPPPAILPLLIPLLHIPLRLDRWRASEVPRASFPRFFFVVCFPHFSPRPRARVWLSQIFHPPSAWSSTLMWSCVSLFPPEVGLLSAFVLVFFCCLVFPTAPLLSPSALACVMCLCALAPLHLATFTLRVAPHALLLFVFFFLRRTMCSTRRRSRFASWRPPPARSPLLSLPLERG